MSKVDIIYNWVIKNLDKVYISKKHKIVRIGISVNKTTKNGEMVEDKTMTLGTDKGNLICFKDDDIKKVSFSEDKQLMFALITIGSTLVTQMFANDPSWFDEDRFIDRFEKEEKDEDEDNDEMAEKWDTMVSNIDKAANFAANNGTSVGEALHHLFNKKEEKEWPSKEYINENGDTCIKPIVCIKGNNLVQNYIKNNKHGNLGIAYFNEKYGFGGKGNFEVHEKESLCHLSERFLIVTEGDEQYEEAPCLVLNDNEEVRVLTPSWAVESGKPSILCAKGTDNDRFIIYPIIDYPTPIMGTLVETEKQFDNLFNFKPLSVDVNEYDNLHDETMDALIKDTTKKGHDGEKDTKDIVNKTDERRYEKVMSINTDEMRDKFKEKVRKFVEDTNNKIEKDGCAAKNFKDIDRLVNENLMKQVTAAFPQSKVINIDNADGKTKEFVKELLQEQENFSRKVHGDEAIDATLKCMNKCKKPNLNDVNILLGDEEADENDKEQIAECIADGGACLEVASDEADDNEIDKYFKYIAEYMQKMKVSNIYFNLEADGTVTCESRIVASYHKN